MVLSDEIHGDFVRKGHRYVPFATLKDRAVVENSITCNAISKTFNLAGMKNAYFYSKSPVLLERVKQYHRAELSTLGVVANEAAYAEGQDWFDQARDYIDGTHDLVEQTVKAKMPEVGYVRNEGTFMTFLNFEKVIKAIDPSELAQYGGKDPGRKLPGLADLQSRGLSKRRIGLRRRQRWLHAHERGERSLRGVRRSRRRCGGH